MQNTRKERQPRKEVEKKKVKKEEQNQKTTKEPKKVRPPNPQTRRWCFTLFPEKLPIDFFKVLNPDGLLPYQTAEQRKEHVLEDLKRGVIALDKDVLNSLLYYDLGARGLLYSLESGDSKEHLHIQGYLEFWTPIRFKRLQAIIGYGVHLEAAKGARLDNFNYILHAGEHENKGTLYESEKIGEWPETSGDERGVYAEAVSMVLDGIPVQTIARSFGGGILTQIGNLVRLKNEVDQDRTRYIRAARDIELLKNDIPF